MHFFNWKNWNWKILFSPSFVVLLYEALKRLRIALNHRLHLLDMVIRLIKSGGTG